MSRLFGDFDEALASAMDDSPRTQEDLLVVESFEDGQWSTVWSQRHGKSYHPLALGRSMDMSPTWATASSLYQGTLKPGSNNQFGDKGPSAEMRQGNGLNIMPLPNGEGRNGLTNRGLLVIGDTTYVATGGVLRKVTANGLEQVATYDDNYRVILGGLDDGRIAIGASIEPKRPHQWRGQVTLVDPKSKASEILPLVGDGFIRELVQAPGGDIMVAWDRAERGVFVSRFHGGAWHQVTKVHDDTTHVDMLVHNNKTYLTLALPGPSDTGRVVVYEVSDQGLIPLANQAPDVNVSGWQPSLWVHQGTLHVSFLAKTTQTAWSDVDLFFHVRRYGNSPDKLRNRPTAPHQIVTLALVDGQWVRSGNPTLDESLRSVGQLSVLGCNAVH